jgi:formiminotetrahydrofolate cyclodeaminase
MTSGQQLGKFVHALAAKQSTPGGGAAAAVGAAVGAAAANMAAAYSQRKKDQESGAAERAQNLMDNINLESFLTMADDDADAYAALQRTWKETDMTYDEKAAIEARALAVPTNLLTQCHMLILQIQEFLPHCNPNITSDAKVGVHQLAGAARAAYQTVLVNKPAVEERNRLRALLKEIRDVEEEMLDIDVLDQLEVE